MAERWPFEGLERGAYDVITMDVPWKFKGHTADPGNRAPEKHYRTMTLAEIAALPVRELARKDCHLMFWTTGPFLQKAFAIIDGYGWRYSSMFNVWVKLKRSLDPHQMRLLPTADGDLHVGLGFTTRKNAEFCILARRGSPKRESRSVREIILSPVREHSRKPDEFRLNVDRYIGPGKRVCELFARSGHPGWDAWGDEINRFK